VRIKVQGPGNGFNYVQFVPPNAAVGPTDTLVFEVVTGQAQQTIEPAANTSASGRCVTQTATTVPTFTAVTVAPGATSAPVTVSNVDFSSTVPTVVPFKGNSADCINGLRGQIMFGTFNVNCAAQTTRQACTGEGSKTGLGNVACVWCGTSDNSGTCFVPSWYGVNSCPCSNDNSCFPNYGCAAGSTVVSYLVVILFSCASD
jgi:hypothetical protein